MIHPDSLDWSMTVEIAKILKKLKSALWNSSFEMQLLIEQYFKNPSYLTRWAAWRYFFLSQNFSSHFGKEGFKWCLDSICVWSVISIALCNCVQRRSLFKEKYQPGIAQNMYNLLNLKSHCKSVQLHNISSSKFSIFNIVKFLRLCRSFKGQILILKLHSMFQKCMIRYEFAKVLATLCVKTKRMRDRSVFACISRKLQIASFKRLWLLVG